MPTMEPMEKLRMVEVPTRNRGPADGAAEGRRQPVGVVAHRGAEIPGGRRFHIGRNWVPMEWSTKPKVAEASSAAGSIMAPAQAT